MQKLHWIHSNSGLRWHFWMLGNIEMNMDYFTNYYLSFGHRDMKEQPKDHKWFLTIL